MVKVLGIGNALVDILSRISGDYVLEDLNLPKGSMQLVDAQKAEEISQATQHMEKSQASGGSSANTIHGLANLGVATGFIGKVGNDSFGSFFYDDLIKSQIEPKLLQGLQPTGRAAAFVSLDSERTFATYLGSAVELNASEINQELLEGYNWLYVEGYLVQNHELIAQSITLAKERGMKVALDLASFNVVEENLEFLKEMATNVDLLFANEEEARAFTGQEPEAALEELAKVCPLVVVKVGKEGAFIKNGSEKVHVPALDAKPIDTTGAGDLFAAGFIYGLINDMTLENCGHIGSLLAGHVIQVMGPKMDEERWETIREGIKKFC